MKKQTLLTALAFIIVAAVAYVIGAGNSNDTAAAIVASENTTAAEASKPAPVIDEKALIVLSDTTYQPMIPSGFTQQVAIINNQSKKTAKTVELTRTYTLVSGEKRSFTDIIKNVGPGEYRNYEIEDYSRGVSVLYKITNVKF